MPTPGPYAPTTKQAADRIVLEYLRRRGYKTAEAAFLASTSSSSQSPTTTAATPSSPPILDDASVDDSLRQVLAVVRDSSGATNHDVSRYADAYHDLHTWVQHSLDVYKPQLSTILYPLLIHCFLEMVRRGDHWKQARSFLHSNMFDFIDRARLVDPAADPVVRRDELLSLYAIASPQHRDENEVARLYLANRYEVYMSYYAFELLLAFLAEDPRRSVLLQILNSRCRIRFDAASDGVPFVGFARRDEPLTRPSTATKSQSQDANNNNSDKIGIVADEDVLNSRPDTDILWGRLRREHYIMSDEESLRIASLKRSEKSFAPQQQHPSKQDSLDNNNNPTPTSAAIASANNSATNKKDVAGLPATTTGTGSPEEDEEPVVRDDGTINRSRIPLKRYRSGALGLETAADMKARAKLRVSDAGQDGIRKDLAILFYTITNAAGDGIGCTTVSADGAQLAAGCADSSVRVWDARATGTPGSTSGGLSSKPRRMVGHSGPVYDVDFTKCGRYIVSCGEDGMVRLWNVNVGAPLVVYRGHNFPIWSVSFSPLDHYFVSASHDRTARVWVTEREHPVRILAGHLSDVDCTAWHPNVNYIATGSADRCVRLWDVRDGQCARMLRAGACGAVNALAFAPDGRSVAAAGDSGIVKVWDMRQCGTDDVALKTLKGHRAAVWSLDYSRDGAVLASGGADWRVCIWRAEEWSSVIGVEEERERDRENEGEGGVTTDGGDEEDVDGDVKMEGMEQTKQKKEKVQQTNTANINTTKKSHAQTQKNASAIASGSASGSAAAWNNVPLVEVFETKETPVQLVKFTRRNLLIAAGTFGT